MMTALIRPTMFLRLLLLIGFIGLPGSGKAALTASWSGTQALPDYDASGVAYSFNLSDPATSITSVSVTLSISGGYNSDLYAYLSNGSGYAVLLNRVGISESNPDGYLDSGFNVTLSSSSSADIHQYQSLGGTLNGNGQLTGTWAADGRFIDPTTSSGAAYDAATRNNTLSTFIGTNPNDTWTLFIADVSGGGISTLNSWSVDVQPIPEPTSMSLLLVGALTAGAAWRRKRKNRTPSC